MSYLELYNENIRDLLNPSSGYLELRDECRGRNSNWVIPGLTEVSTTSTDEVTIVFICYKQLERQYLIC